MGLVCVGRESRNRQLVCSSLRSGTVVPKAARRTKEGKRDEKDRKLMVAGDKAGLLAD